MKNKLYEHLQEYLKLYPERRDSVTCEELNKFIREKNSTEAHTKNTQGEITNT